MEEKKEKKIAALLKKSDTTEQTAVQIVSQNNLSSDKITETKSEVSTEELATRVSGVEALIPKIDVKIGKVSKKVDNLKGSTNKKFERITKEIDIIAEGLDDNNKKATKLSALIEKNKKDGDKDSKKSEKGNNKIITILTNMLDFMKLTYEQDTLAREQQNNFSEEQKAEKDRRDKELLDALKGKKKPTAEKIDDKDNRSFLEKILGAMASILGPLKTFMSLIGTLFTTLSKIFTTLTKFIGTAGRLLFTVGRFFLMNPVGIALLTVASIGALLMLASKEAHEEGAKGMVNAGKDSAVGEAIMDVTEATDENAISAKKNNLLADRPKSKKSVLFWKDGDLQKEYLKEIGWDEKTGTTKKERDDGATKLDASGNLVYPKLPAGMTMQEFDKARNAEEPDAKVPVTNVKPRPTDALKAQVWDSKYAGGWNPDGTPKNKSEPKSTETPPKPVTAPAAPAVTPVAPAPKGDAGPVSSATPITDTPNLGTQMATMSNENALEKTVEEIAVTSSAQVNNVMAATKKIIEHTIDKIPSVRNQEETFQRMILNSTRVV